MSSINYVTDAKIQTTIREECKHRMVSIIPNQPDLGG